MRALLNTIHALTAAQVRAAAAKLVPAGFFDQDFTTATAPVGYLRSLLEDAAFERDMTPAAIIKAAETAEGAK